MSDFEDEHRETLRLLKLSKADPKAEVTRQRITVKEMSQALDLGSRLIEQQSAELSALRAERDGLTLKVRDADRLADEVAVLTLRRVIDQRSPAADALLDYRSPPVTPRADRIAALETERDGLLDALRTARSFIAQEIADAAQLVKTGASVLPDIDAALAASEG